MLAIHCTFTVLSMYFSLYFSLYFHCTFTVLPLYFHCTFTSVRQTQAPYSLIPEDEVMSSTFLSCECVALCCESLSLHAVIITALSLYFHLLFTSYSPPVHLLFTFPLYFHFSPTSPSALQSYPRRRGNVQHFSFLRLCGSLL
jgi:hypothetical protein